jgi:metal-responsive CopG/Arc/MetJ family transcriptional regulator
MAGIKTAISLEQNLLEQVNKNAEEMQVSRSKFFAMAVKDFIQKRQNQKILDKLNSVYDDRSNEDESKTLNAMRAKQNQMLKEEPWE